MIITRIKQLPIRNKYNLVKASGEFGGAGCRVVAVCLDSTFSIIDWIETSKELKALNNIIPIISDRDAKISRY